MTQAMPRLPARKRRLSGPRRALKITPTPAAALDSSEAGAILTALASAGLPVDGPERSTHALVRSMWIELHRVDRQAAHDAFRAAQQAGAPIETILDLADLIHTYDQIRKDPTK